MNWDSESYWQEESFGRKGVVIIPACNWGGDKFSWIEKKASLPFWQKISLQFYRHSAAYSEFVRQWTDGLLRVIVKSAAGTQVVLHGKLYSGEWSLEAVVVFFVTGERLLL